MTPRGSTWLRLVTLAVLLAACTASVAPTARDAALDALDLGGGGGSEPAGPVRVTVSSRDRLPTDIVRAARSAPGVLSSGSRRTGLLSLVETFGAERPLPKRPAGTILPISVEAQDPALLDAFLHLAAAANALRLNRAVLPRSQAEFRGLEVGDAIGIANGRRRVRLTIGAIVEDDRVIRSEVVIPAATAQRLRMEPARTLILAVAADAAPSVGAAIERLAGDRPIRVRMPRPDPQPNDGTTRRLLGLAEVKMIFGEFWYRPRAGIQISVDPAWRRANIVERRVPLLGTFQCHRKIVPLLIGAMNEMRTLGLDRLIRSFSGCYSPRMQVGDDGELSRHAFGIAVDINAGSNPYGATPRQDPRLVEVMERWGFTWGGRWSVPDGMHFEFSTFP